MTFWSAPGQTFFIALFSGEIRAELALSHGEFGAIYSAGKLLSAVAIIWTGSYIDRIKLPIFAITVVFGLALACLALSLSTGIFSLVISVFLLRQFGQALMVITASTTMVRYLDDHKGKANALSGMGYRVSEAALPTVVVAFLAAQSWRHGLQFTAAILVFLLAPVIAYLLKNHADRHTRYEQALSDEQELGSEHHVKSWRRNEVLADWRFYCFIPALACAPLLFTGFIFHQVHLVESKGWTIEFWSSLFILYGLVSVTLSLVSGGIIDRYNAIRLVPLLPIPLGIALTLISFGSNLWIAALFFIFMAAATGTSATVSAPFFSEIYGTKYLGSIKSISTAIMVFASALSPFLIGACLDQGISIEALALAGVAYTIIASALSAVAAASTKTRVS